MTIENTPEGNQRPPKRTVRYVTRFTDSQRPHRERKKKRTSEAHRSGSQGRNNSEDEYGDSKSEKSKSISSSQDGKLTIVKIKSDGSCLFRAISFLLYGDQEHHNVLRQCCMKHIDSNWVLFKDFVTENKYSYLARKSLPSCHGNHVEITALAYMLNIQITILNDDLEHISSVSQNENSNVPILKLCYKNQEHYDAIIDKDHPVPHRPPPSVKESPPSSSNTAPDESGIVEQAYIQSQIQMSEWDEAEQQILEAVKLQSLQELSSSQDNSNQLHLKANQPSSTSKSKEDLKKPTNDY